MKAVLISIQPKWCELIASGKKTVEVRKKKPKLETPFKVYIYATWNGKKTDILVKQGKTLFVADYRTMADRASGKVIGEFVCDNIFTIRYSCGSYRCEGLNRHENDRIASASQLSLYDMRNYLSCNGGYAWHISDLVIYDKPKELGDFRLRGVNKMWSTAKKLERPPQSWCYVEEVQDGKCN